MIKEERPVEIGLDAIANRDDPQRVPLAERGGSWRTFRRSGMKMPKRLKHGAGFVLTEG